MIRLVGYMIVKGGDGVFHVGSKRLIDKWNNDYFYDKLDIFSEEDWGKFISDYEKNGKKLVRKDKNNNYYCYTIEVRGATSIMKEFFDNKHLVSCYLFPQEQSMKGKTQKLIDLNKKFVKLSQI